MEEASRKLARGDAAAAAVDLIEELAESRKGQRKPWQDCSRQAETDEVAD